MQVGTSNFCPGEGRARSLVGINVLRMKITYAELEGPLTRMERYRLSLQMRKDACSSGTTRELVCKNFQPHPRPKDQNLYLKKIPRCFIGTIKLKKHCLRV